MGILEVGDKVVTTGSVSVELVERYAEDPEHAPK